MSPPLSGYDVTLLSWVDHIHKRNFQSRPKAATALVSRLRADNLFYSYILALESIFHLWSELQKGWNISFSYSVFAKCSSASPSGYYLCSRVTRRITHKSGITKKIPEARQGTEWSQRSQLIEKGKRRSGVWLGNARWNVGVWAWRERRVGEVATLSLLDDDGLRLLRRLSQK